MLTKELINSNRKDLGETEGPTEECRSPPGSTRMKSLATKVADLQYTLKGVQDRDQEWGWEQVAEQAFR